MNSSNIMLTAETEPLKRCPWQTAKLKKSFTDSKGYETFTEEFIFSSCDMENCPYYYAKAGKDGGTRKRSFCDRVYNENKEANALSGTTSNRYKL